jgi:hypothetical protein
VTKTERTIVDALDRIEARLVRLEALLGRQKKAEEATALGLPPAGTGWVDASGRVRLEMVGTNLVMHSGKWPGAWRDDPRTNNTAREKPLTGQTVEELVKAVGDCLPLGLCPPGGLTRRTLYGSS